MKRSGRVLTPLGLQEGELEFAERVVAFRPLPVGQDSPYLLPGFIDLHVHGGGGADCMDGEEALRQMARFHASHGTTALLATTLTAAPPELERAVRAAGRVERAPGPAESAVLGVHLEGPFLNPERLGAQPPWARDPDPGEVRSLERLATLRALTLAPELPGALELTAELAARGIRVQLGHTAATAEQAEIALRAGASGFTHLYNAMTGLRQRQPGVVAAALARGRWAEVIGDGLHVERLALLAALRAIPGLYLITDAMAAAGMPPGRYHLGGQAVLRRGAGAYLEGDGRTLAGSVLTLDQALRNLVSWGIGIELASALLSARPAHYLGLPDRGHLVAGSRADLVVLNSKLELLEVFVAGLPVPGMPAASGAG